MVASNCWKEGAIPVLVTSPHGFRGLAVGPGLATEIRAIPHNGTAVDVLEGIEDGKGKGGQKTNIYLQYICS
jgi:hypothetical protein